MECNELVIDDLIVLGNAVPDEIRDKRKTVCTAGYSPKHGMIRVYPVPPNAGMNRWNIVEIPLEKNNKDTRKESWKIQGSKSEWPKLKSKIKHQGKLAEGKRIDLLKEMHKKFGVGCIEDLNRNKLSLGFIKPKDIKWRLEKRKHHDASVQTTLFSNEPFLTIKNYDMQPRMTYTCSECKAKKQHDQQILEWGVYEWFRKNPTNMNQVWDNLGLTKSGYDISFLVGNMFLHKNSFMIISILRYKMTS